MAQSSKIEWTEATWNPTTGCSKVSPGCKNCYAEKMAMRLQAMGQSNYKNGFALTLQPHMLELPLKWKKPKLVFVNSMSDLFHEDVPLDYIKKVFAVMRNAHWHTYQLLTKRSERVAHINSKLEWCPNIWMGVSVENENYTHRIDHLRETNAHVKFLSLEPLIGQLSNLYLKEIDWVIVGGESGPNARIVKEEWITDIQLQCNVQDVPFFFKQWGAWGADGQKRSKQANGRQLAGKFWNEMPRLIYD